MKKQQIKLIIAVAALVILIIVASVLYARLGDRYKPNSLITQGGSDTKTPVQDEIGDTVTVDLSGGETDAPEDTSETSAETESEDNGLAPDFSMADREGNSFKLSDFRGKPVILNFWASWCPPCKSEMPDFESAYKEYGEDINFIMLNVTDGSRETVETAKSFIESAGYTFPVYFDTGLEGSIAYGASSIPMTFFIDAEGKMVAYGMGMLDASSLAQGIGMLLE
ncbi:MAG: TlpA family protein disulfide reductase [Clostridia bacterium]|nr:TlpA family protein disulfide reductase [Clostridia bacterium]